MENSTQSESNQEMQLADYIMVGVLISLIVAAVLLVYSYRQSIGKTLKEFGYSPLAIATNPDAATILLDGHIVGVSPLTIKTSPGAHVVAARKDGYKHASMAIDLERDIYEDRRFTRGARHKESPWAVNLSLEVDPTASRAESQPPQADSSAFSGNADSDIALLRGNIRDLRELVLADPEAAVSLSVVKERVESLERDNSTLRDELKELRATWIQFISILATILLGLFGVAATIFIGRHKSS